MPRSTNNVASRRRRKKILKAAKGFWGARKNTIRRTKNAVIKAMQHAYRHRKTKKREMRSLWITRINAAVRLFDLSYNQFIYGLKKGNVIIDRKMLADIAANDIKSFENLVKLAKENL